MEHEMRGASPEAIIITEVYGVSSAVWFGLDRFGQADQSYRTNRIYVCKYVL